jgi:DNA-binding IclR family transcriptional regulator
VDSLAGIYTQLQEDKDDMPPREPQAGAPHTPQARLAPTPEALRQLILDVLAQHPAGLTPGAVASQLGLTTSLTATLQAMTREGLLRRISAEVYAVAENP